MTPKIVVKHTSIVVNNYELGDCPKLENFFTIYNRVTHSEYYKGIDYIPEEKKLILPRGLDIYYLERLLNERAAVDYKHDPYDTIENVMIKYPPRDDEQRTAIRFILGLGEFDGNQHKSQLSLNLTTSKGKTYIFLATTAYLSLRSITITCSLDWLNQWRERILEHTNTLPKEIYMITGVASIAKIVRGLVDVNKIKFFLASHDTIKSYGDTYGWDKVTELFKMIRVGIKAYDEAHLSFDNMLKIDFHTNTMRTVYLTATPTRSDEDEKAIYKLAFKNVPGIDLFDKTKDARTRYVAFIYNSHLSAKQISECKNKYGLNRPKYVDYVVEQDNFHNMMHILMYDIIKKNTGKTLLYVATNESILYVKKWIEENYPEYRSNIGVYTSIIPKDQKEIEKSKNIILSTTKSFGAAMDVRNITIAVVLAEPFKSEVLAVQTFGRPREQNSTYIEIVDAGVNQTMKYYEAKKPIYDKYATSCSESRFSDSMLHQRAMEIKEARLFMTVPMVRFEHIAVKPMIIGPHPYMWRPMIHQSELVKPMAKVRL